jgi:hypothetical protein
VREPATGEIVVGIPALSDCAYAIDDRPGAIEFKRQLGQAVEITIRMRANHERNLGFGEPDFNCLFHRRISGSALVAFHAS